MQRAARGDLCFPDGYMIVQEYNLDRRVPVPVPVPVPACRATCSVVFPFSSPALESCWPAGPDYTTRALPHGIIITSIKRGFNSFLFNSSTGPCLEHFQPLSLLAFLSVELAHSRL